MKRIIEIEIGCCGDCPYYDWKNHICSKGAIENEEGNYFKDCPLKWREKKEGAV